MAQNAVTRARLIGAIRLLEDALKEHMVTLEESDAEPEPSYNLAIPEQLSLKRIPSQQKFRRKSVQIQTTSKSSETIAFALEDLEATKVEKVSFEITSSNINLS